ncbi:MAG: pilin [Zoogloeaceae bacterium]|nr:pilin [Zoogloeaceae bacterium]
MSEGLTLAAGAKSAATEFYADRGYWPSNNFSAGIASSASITGNAVKAVVFSRATGVATVGGTGTITITYNTKVKDNETLVMKGKGGTQAGSIRWGCGHTNKEVDGSTASDANYGTLAMKYQKWIPARCRG